MSLQSLATFIPAMKHGLGTNTSIRMFGGFPTVVTNAASISVYTVLDQIAVGPSWVPSMASQSVARLFDVNFYLKLNSTYSVAPSVTAAYLTLYLNTTSMASATATGMLLATSNVNTLAATTVNSQILASGSSTSPTPYWNQVSMLNQFGQHQYDLHAGDVISLVLNFATSGATMTALTVDARALVNMTTLGSAG